MRVLRSKSGSPLAAIRAYADAVAGLSQSPDLLAHDFTWLQLDRSDPDGHRATLKHAQVVRRALCEFVKEAIELGELRADVYPEHLARSLQAMVGGALMLWAVDRDGSALTWVRSCMAVLLDPLIDGLDAPRRAVRRALARLRR